MRSLAEGELAAARALVERIDRGDEARASLARLGGIEEKSLLFGDGWAASVEIDGTSLLVRGEPAGASAGWTILGQPGTEGEAHAARRLSALVSEEAAR